MQVAKKTWIVCFLCLRCNKLNDSRWRKGPLNTSPCYLDNSDWMNAAFWTIHCILFFSTTIKVAPNSATIGNCRPQRDKSLDELKMSEMVASKFLLSQTKRAREFQTPNKDMFSMTCFVLCHIHHKHRWPQILLPAGERKQFKELRIWVLSLPPSRAERELAIVHKRASSVCVYIFERITWLVKHGTGWWVGSIGNRRAKGNPEGRHMK